MVHIFLGSMPAMLADMIEHLVATEGDLSIVGKVRNGECSLSGALAAGADVLVLQHSAVSVGADSILAELLRARPLAILVLSDDGRTGEIYSILTRAVSLETFANTFARAARVATRMETGDGRTAARPTSSQPIRRANRSPPKTS